MARQQYRITFYSSAEVRIDPFEFAWLISKYSLDVVAKPERIPVLFVQAESAEVLFAFAREVNALYGPLIFDCLEVATDSGYEEVESP